MTQDVQTSPAPPRRRPAGRTLLWIVAVVLAAIAFAVLLSRCAGRTGGRGFAGRPTVTVGIARATLGDVPITIAALGTVTPEATVQVVAKVSGTLQAVYFREGQLVRRGQVLALVDPSAYRAALEQAQGQLARDQALLAGARVDLARYQLLLAQKSIAEQTVADEAATVKQDQGAVATDRGAVNSARLNLSWTRIVAPLDGRVGLRQIDPGNQVSAGQTTPIVVVTRIDPIDVVFAVPEETIASIIRHPDFGAGLPVTAYDRSGGQALAQGALATIDNLVDTTTGTVKGKARFANPGGALFPNQFVNVGLLVDTLKNQVIVPATAVRHGPQGDFVWVLQQPGQYVRMRKVTTGPGSGETVSVASGLAAGETVITEGGDRLSDCARVMLPGQPPPGGRRHRRFGGRSRGGRRGAMIAGGAGGGCPAAGATRGPGAPAHPRNGHRRARPGAGAGG
ncbi:MAG TPA: efflux RND transporter periplasmic adaptor subunit [Caulobacteraceae bacterium]|nr:efflux RND transporter periplasmic adaptor subunit [Caulobacteraceae bacterium]